MNDHSDSQLLRAYAEERSEPAFAELVRRHIDLVYSAARRMVCDAHLAEDVTQGVFVALAKNASHLTDRPVLSGWLHRTAQNIAAQTVRTDVRRRAREQEVAAMNELLHDPTSAIEWEKLRPVLDAAMFELKDVDHDAILLRFFENRPLTEVGAKLGLSQDAARKRVDRAVEKLRVLLAQRGITTAAAALGAALSANAVHVAPAGLAAMVAGASLATAAANTGTTLAVLKWMTMTTLQKTVLTAALVAAIGVGVYEVRRTAKSHRQVEPRQAERAAPEWSVQIPLIALDAASPPAAGLQNKIERLTNTATTQQTARPNEEPTATVATAPPETNPPTASSPEPEPEELPRETWADAGFETPEAALKTRGWSVLTGNRERFKESLSITAGARKMIEDMILKTAAESNAADRDRSIEEAVNNRWGAEEAILMPMIGLNQRNGFVGYRVLSRRSPAPDELILDVETKMETAPPQREQLKLRRIGQDWKVVIDEDVISSAR